MNRAYKYRVYPTAEQEQLLTDTFGSCRFVYNHYLALQSENCQQGKAYRNKTACNNDCNRILKQEQPWLKQVDKFALTNAIYALDSAYRRFFRRQGGYPRFKSRHHSRMSYTTNYTNGNIAVLAGEIKLPKLGKVGAVVHRRAPEDWRLKQATVSRESDGSYYVSVLYEYEAAIMPQAVNPEQVIGLDYKSAGLYMDSEGRCCGMPHYYRKNQKKLIKAQRKLKAKQLQSVNYRKQQKKIARIAKKAANQRKDYLHKKSTEIANRYDLVCVEDLSLRALANRGFGNGKATMDNGYGSFLTMLKYKLEERGKRLIRIEKWYASSKTCSRCGAVKMMPLSVRRYECNCGMSMDRDLNAAINIRNRGYEIYLKAA